ncbi:MAG: inositol monophosphatase [Bacteroidetes bacterium]|nr:inositol monophosphatase [Bacteroidota bacterium]MBU1114845.1 inositol monophosphatase [Bacteroidota bacterium]MBU1797568.1 inositol monophosphatase [Bacteroidota bacterium]
MINEIIEISREAGEVIREGFGKKLTLEYKTNISDFVTNIDKASEQKIIDFIKKKYPKHNILAEESGAENFNSDYTWVIDPLDGTVNFAHGLPIFSVSIAILRKKEIIAGAIYDVMNNIMFSSEKGSGSFQNGKRIYVSENSDLDKSLLVTGFPYNIKQNPDNAIEKFSRFVLNSRGVRRLGSAAIDLCYVANGTFDGFWEVNLHPWDMAAGMLLVKEAGGKITDFTNNKNSIFSKQLLATNGKVHDRMIQILNNN